MYVNSDVIGSNNNVSLDSVREGEHLIIPIFKLQSTSIKLIAFLFSMLCAIAVLISMSFIKTHVSTGYYCNNKY